MVAQELNEMKNLFEPPSDMGVQASPSLKHQGDQYENPILEDEFLVEFLETKKGAGTWFKDECIEKTI